MRISELLTDREKHPLMNDLHQLGLKYGLKFIVLAYDDRGDGQTLLIDHKDDTTAMEMAVLFEAAGVHFIKVGAAAADLAAREASIKVEE